MAIFILRIKLCVMRQRFKLNRCCASQSCCICFSHKICACSRWFSSIACCTFANWPNTNRLFRWLNLRLRAQMFYNLLCCWDCIDKWLAQTNIKIISFSTKNYHAFILVRWPDLWWWIEMDQQMNLHQMPVQVNCQRFQTINQSKPIIGILQI